jgi:glycosyltransferase involved in cell wall biosynthesis
VKLSVLSVAYPLAPVSPDAAGGSEQILSLLDAELVRRGHRSVVVACDGSRAAGQLVRIPWSCGPLDDGVRQLAQEYHRRAILQAIRRYDFDLIHMHSLDFHAYLPPPGPPVLVTLHLPPSWYPEDVFRIERPNTRLVCVSASQESACPTSPILIPHVPNGVDVDRLATPVRKRCYALALGRICPEKGYHLALDAAARARIPLVLAGEVFRYSAHEAYFRDELQPRLDGRKRRFIGPVALDRKRRLLAGARCLLVPSLVNETSSLVSMEAMACGTPVIAFPSGALAEIVEQGRTGFLVNDVEEMADAIRRVGEIDPAECRRAARERFSANAMLERYFAVYESLVRLAPAACGGLGR